MRSCSKLWMVALAFALAAAPVSAADKLTVGLPWTPQAEFGGFYQAEAEGLYREAGLDVTLQPGGPQVNTQQLLVSGALDMALAANAFDALNAARSNIP